MQRVAGLLWRLTAMGKSVFLNLVAPVLELALAVIFVRRKIYREYPFFFAYLISSICIGILRVSVGHIYRTYFVVFWATSGIYAVLALFVLYEVFNWFFFHLYRYWSWFWVLFPTSAVAVIGGSIWYSLVHPPFQASSVISFVLVFGIAVNFVQLGLFVLFFLLVRIFKLSPWEYAFGIVVGFAAAAAGALLGYLLRSEFGTKFEPFARYAAPVSYIVAVMLWLAVFSAPERELQLPPGITRERLLEEVRRYNGYLDRFLEKFK